ncbi:MAG TPA: isoprenylcysteine carboxylmethyltransferase family protein [Actinomycetota bacterium]|nr:isoprenylcysteine carboxylmethyltransferase family protein [Actinomycetota bacterium]
MTRMRDPVIGARIFFWVAMGIWGGLEVRTSIVRAGSDTGEDAGSQRWSLGATLAGLLGVLIIDAAMSELLVAEEKQTPFLVAGGLVVLGGVALRIWSIRTLGRFFTYRVMTTEDQRVVSGGPYRFVRHPSYTALLVSCIGAGISTANPFALIVAIVVPSSACRNGSASRRRCSSMRSATSTRRSARRASGSLHGSGEA